MDAFKDLNNLYFFAKVVDCGSYTAAAKVLGMQTSKLSRRIGALERELGVRPLNRTTRKLSLTEAGRTLHRHCVALIAEAERCKGCNQPNAVVAARAGSGQLPHRTASRRRFRSPRAVSRHAPRGSGRT
jgi:DNA-binding transcriptional LysR family regulator